MKLLLLRLLPVVALGWGIKTGALESTKLYQSIISSTFTVRIEMEMDSMVKSLFLRCGSGKRLMIKNFTKWLERQSVRKDRKAGKDPFGNPYVLKHHESERRYDIICMGPDGKQGTDDDTVKPFECY